MKIRIYHPHTHAGRQYTPGPDGVEIEVTPAAAKFIKARGLDVPPVAPAIGTEPQSAGEGSERLNPPAAGNEPTSRDATHSSTVNRTHSADAPPSAGKK